MTSTAAVNLNMIVQQLFYHFINENETINLFTIECDAFSLW